MEGLAHKTALQKKPQNEILEISPYTLLKPATHLSRELQLCIEEFWNLTPRVKLFSISKNPHYYWHMQDFYVAQKGLDDEGKRWAQLRISEGLCQFLFESTLGKPLEEPDFTLSRIRNFEVFLLERFSRKLFQIFSPTFLKKPGKKSPPPEKDQLMHLVWALDGEPDQVNQLILTAPQTCLKTVFEGLAPSPIWHIPEDSFMHTHAQVVFKLGTTGARLDDLQQLEPGDIILFEDSIANQWQLQDPVSKGWLKVAVKMPDKIKVPDLFTTQGSHAMANEMQIKQNIWDNLQVEVTATFNPIKLPLKQVKEMEQGLVVEISDLMDNKVKIEVEGHPIAWGELLVIGDKFGVRIQGLQEGTENINENSSAVSTISSGQGQAAGGAYEAEASSPTEDEPDDVMDDLDLDESDFDDLDDEEDWS